MRVLFAITRGETGGAQEHMLVLARGLLRRGVEVGVLVEPNAPLTAAASTDGADVFEWESITRNPHPAHDCRARKELRAVAHEFRPNILALYSSKAGVLGRKVLPRDVGRTIWTCHHLPFGPGRQMSHRLLARPIEQFTLPLVDGIITDGARDMPILRKLAPRVPIRLVPNGVQPTAPVGERTASTAVPPCALWVARFRRPKQPIEAIDAWKTVQRYEPAARLLMCGTGPLVAEARRRAAEARDANGIELLGHVPSLLPYQRQASTFVLTSSVEGGITMATLEAMAQGLVPVLSDVGDAFLLEHASCGIVVPRHSPKAIAHAVLDLWRDPERYAEMSDAAMRFSREQWTSDRMVDATLAFYEDVLRR